MTHQEIIEAFTQYEISHPTETYRCYDWNVWPLLRIFTSYEAIFQSTRQFQLGEKCFNKIARKSRLVLRLGRVAKMLRTQHHREKILILDSDKNQNHIEPDRDVVILTSSGRRQQIGPCLYEIYTDPLVECLRRRGISPLTWERGPELWPRCMPSAWISRLLAAELLKMKKPAPLARPLWYTDFVLFTSFLLGRTISWAEFEAKIQLVQQYSIIFEKWINAVNAKLLVSVCWYDREVMAATLAANRLGVVSADLQHGLQGDTHVAYSGWMSAPSKGYETVPDVFMSWGKISATQTLSSNPAFSAQSATVITGNLWLNKYCHRNFINSNRELKYLKSKIKKHAKVILISLQNRFVFEKFVIDTMQHSLENWFWLIRLHPATSAKERIAIEKRLSVVPKSKFESLLSTKLPLYSLLCFTQIHITGHSTIALEALRFGIPTITITSTGTKVFKSYLTKRVMQQALNARELLSKITLCENISIEACRQSVEDTFASSNIADDGIDRLLSIAGIRKGA